MADESSGDFEFAGGIWFITPAPPFHNLTEFCAVVLRGVFEDGDTGRLIPIVYAFSDDDLAGRFLVAANAPSHYQPYTPGGDAETLAALERLRDNGDAFLLVDPEQNHAVPYPTERAIDQFRKR